MDAWGPLIFGLMGLATAYLNHQLRVIHILVNSNLEAVKIGVLKQALETSQPIPRSR